MCLVFVFFFFFFQAEDGIRDIGVTGVQTCALPICSIVCSLVCKSSIFREKKIELQAFSHFWLTEL